MSFAITWWLEGAAVDRGITWFASGGHSMLVVGHRGRLMHEPQMGRLCMSELRFDDLSRVQGPALYAASVSAALRCVGAASQLLVAAARACAGIDACPSRARRSCLPPAVVSFIAVSTARDAGSQR